MMNLGGGGSGRVRVLAASAVPVSVGGTLAETTLMTPLVLPAGFMGNNGTIRIKPKFKFTASANYKYMRVKFGATTYNQDNGANATYVALSPVIEIQNRNTVPMTQLMTPSFTAGIFGTTTNAWLTPSEDTTNNPVTISITGQTTLETGFTPVTTNISGNGTVVTVNQTAHGLNTGEYIKASGSSTNGYNVDPVQVTVVNANQFTYPATGSGTPATAPLIQRYSVLTLMGYVIEYLPGVN